TIQVAARAALFSFGARDLKFRRELLAVEFGQAGPRLAGGFLGLLDGSIGFRVADATEQLSLDDFGADVNEECFERSFDGRTDSDDGSGGDAPRQNHFLLGWRSWRRRRHGRGCRRSVGPPRDHQSGGSDREQTSGDEDPFFQTNFSTITTSRWRPKK